MKLKKLFSTIISVLMMLSVVSSTACAVSGDAASEEYGGVIDLRDIEGYLSGEHFKSLSPSEQQAILNKLSIFTSDVSVRSTITSHYFAMTHCVQINDHYCGPATVRQTLLKLIGSVFTATQGQIATAIGTTTAGSDLPPMCDYINQNNELCHYIIVQNPTIDEMKSIITCDIPCYVPIICRLKLTPGGNWLYPSTGHFMNVNGFDFSGTPDKVWVTDPNITRVVPSYNGTYWVTLEELYTATIGHSKKQIAY